MAVCRIDILLFCPAFSADTVILDQQAWIPSDDIFSKKRHRLEGKDLARTRDHFEEHLSF